MSWYLDSSAIIKLILKEEESIPLQAFIRGAITTSIISRIEVTRNVHRLNPGADDKALFLLDKLNFVSVSDAVINFAESVSKATSLKTLDALQVASAMSVANRIEGIITYDRQLSINAEQLGLKVFAPA